MMTPLRLFLAGTLGFCALSCARADFSGGYDVGAAGSYNLVSGETTDFGAWSASLVTNGTGGSAWIDTQSAPGALALNVMGHAEGGTGSLSFTHDGFSTNGIVSFSFTGGPFVVLLDNVVQTASGSAYSFAVSAGQVLEFDLSATGTHGFYDPGMPDPMNPGMWIIPPMMFPGFPMMSTVTLSDFVAPSSPIPEPASAPALAGGALLIVALIRRRRA